MTATTRKRPEGTRAGGARSRASWSANAPALDKAELRREILSWPIEVRDYVAPLFGPNARRAARLAERDDQLALMAASKSGSLSEVSDALHVELLRYAGSSWSYERHRDAPRDKRHFHAHRVLKLNGGKVLKARTIREILAEKTGGNRQRGARS